MAQIGIKLASGELYPVLEEGMATGKKLVVTTVRNDQTSVHIDLYKTEGERDASYIGSLVIDDIQRGSKGAPDIELELELDEANNLKARAVDKATGGSSGLSVNLAESGVLEAPESAPDFSLDEFSDTIEIDIPDSDPLPEIMDDAESGETEELPSFDDVSLEEPTLEEPAVEESSIEDMSFDDIPTIETESADEFSISDVEAEDEFSIPAVETETEDEFSIPDLDEDTQETDSSAKSTLSPGVSLLDDDFSIPDIDDSLPPMEDFSGTSETRAEETAEEPSIPSIDDFTVEEEDPSLLARSEQIRKRDESIDFQLEEETSEKSGKNEYKPFKTEKTKEREKSPLILILGIIAGVVLLVLCGLLVYQCSRSSASPTVVEQPKPAEIKSDPVKPAPLAPVEVKPEVKPEETKVEPPQPAPVKPEPAKPANNVEAKKPGVWYKIKWGDTLWDLANAYYRNPWLWKKIWKANKIKNPDLIISGRWLYIPKK